VLALEEEWLNKDELLCVCVKIAVFFKLLCVSREGRDMGKWM
jgi:hypothetical protein